MRWSSGSWSSLISPVFDQGAGRGLDVDGQGVRDGVGDVDEFEVEGAHLELLTAGNLNLGGVLVVFLALGVHEGEGQLGADQRDVRTQLEQVGHAADVVLVAVGEHQGVDLVETVLDVAEIGRMRSTPGCSSSGKSTPQSMSSR